MQRRILATSAVVLLLSAVVLAIWWPQAELTLAFCWRTGAVLAACWVAFDDLQRLPNWLLLTLPVLLIVLAKWPTWFLLATAIVVGLAVLRRLLFPPPK